MGKCYDCGSDLVEGASYCAHCGREIISRKERERRHKIRTDQKDKEKIIIENSLKNYSEYRSKIKEQASIRNPIVFIISIVACLLVYFLSLPFFILFILPFAMVFWVNPARWLSSNEYYSISGSRFENGSHRCIFCGAKGIYRKGQYKTNNTYSYCSKCGKPLFKS